MKFETEIVKRNILLTGATGFIGKQLVKHLLAQGHQVTALYRNEKTPRMEAISWVRVGDLAMMPLDPIIGRGFDVFISLAATLRPSSGEVGLKSQNVAIAENLSRFLTSAGIPRALILSSIAASVAECNPTQARPYGMEKLAADKIFLDLANEGQDLVILRPPAVYGQGMQSSMSALARLIHKGVPLPLGAAVAPRNYISIDNLCHLVATIVGSGDEQYSAAAGRIFEPSDGQIITTRELIRMMGSVMGRPARLLPVPVAMLRTLGTITGRSELVSSAIDPLNVAPVAELEAAFGWRPVENMPESLFFLRDEFRSS